MNTNRPCSELKIEKNHANTRVVLLSTESRPNTQVSPSNGRRITVALISCLHAYTISIGINMLLNDMRVDTLTRITVKIPFFQFVSWLTFSVYRHCAKQPRGRIYSPVCICRYSRHV